MVRGLFIFFDKMKLNYEKLDGILPAVVQNAKTGRVLMVGFMNEEAFGRLLNPVGWFFTVARAGGFGSREKRPGIS